MDRNVDGSSERKKENLQRMFTTAEFRLEQRLQRVMSEVRGADGEPPSRAFKKIMYDEQKAAGVFGRRFVEGRKKKTPLPQLERILDEMRDWLVNDLYGGRSESSGAAKRTA